MLSNINFIENNVFDDIDDDEIVFNPNHFNSLNHRNLFTSTSSNSLIISPSNNPPIEPLFSDDDKQISWTSLIEKSNLIENQLLKINSSNLDNQKTLGNNSPSAIGETLEKNTPIRAAKPPPGFAPLSQDNQYDNIVARSQSPHLSNDYNCSKPSDSKYMLNDSLSNTTYYENDSFVPPLPPPPTRGPPIFNTSSRAP